MLAAPRRVLAFAAVAGCASAPDRPAPADEPPAVVLDHVWIATPRDALEARAALQRAGFRIAPSINRHDGQGTASATVEFENGYLELIWADEGVPVTGSGGRAQERFALRADWKRSGHCPFGLALSRSPATPDDPPFETWRVTSDWMQPGTWIEMWTPRGSPALTIALHPSPVDEAANRSAIERGGAAAWMFLHPNGARRLSGVAVTAPDASGLPPSAALVRSSGAARLEVGGEWLLQLCLDGGARGIESDLRPALPLVIRR